MVSVKQVFSAAITKESLEISNLERVFSAVGRRSKALPKIALFCGFLKVVGEKSVLSREMRIVSRKFGSSARNSKQSVEMYRSLRTFLLAREVSHLQVKF